MPDNRVDTTRPEYSWIPFFEELARRLHEDDWRNRQPQIVAELQRMRREDLLVPEFVDKMDDWIDPFSVMALIRRNNIKPENMARLMKDYKTVFAIDADPPVEIPIVPTVINVQSFYVPDTFGEFEVNAHWDTLGYIIDAIHSESELSTEKFAELLNRSREVKNVDIATLTGALYCIDPHRFLKNDTMDHVVGRGWGFSGSKWNFGLAYVEGLQNVKQAEPRPFPEINNREWLFQQFKGDKKATARKVWQITAERDQVDRERYLSGGYAGFGWANEANLTEAENPEDVRNLTGLSGNALGQAVSFALNISIGDVVIIHAGEKGTYRWGLVNAKGGIFDPNRSDGGESSNRRGVSWMSDPVRLTGLGTGHFGTLTNRSEADFGVVRQILDSLADEPETLNVPEIAVEYKPTTYGIDTMLEEGVFLESEEIERTLSLLRRKQNLILQGPPGTGKTFIARRLAYALMGAKDESRIASVQFHQSYSYEDFVGGLRPDVNADDQLVFKAIDGAFLRLCKRARKDEDNDYVMLIDEINRGNLSRVFGELMMLIEPDKREEDQAIDLPHRAAMVKACEAESAKFHVPKNVYIIGTMNLADRSLTGMNVAMRRRFGFVDLRPQFGELRFDDWLAENGLPRDDEELSRLRNKIIERMTELNRSIQDDRSLGAQYAVGHSFFCPGEDDPVGGDWDAWYMAVIEHEIKPLLKEYWFDQPEKAEDAVKQLLND